MHTWIFEFIKFKYEKRPPRRHTCTECTCISTYMYVFTRLRIYIYTRMAFPKENAMWTLRICMRMCMSVRVCISEVRASMCIFVYVCAHVHVHVYVHVCMCVCVYIYIYINKYIYIFACLYVQLKFQMELSLYSHVCVCVRIRTISMFRLRGSQ